MTRAEPGPHQGGSALRRAVGDRDVTATAKLLATDAQALSEARREDGPLSTDSAFVHEVRIAYQREALHDFRRPDVPEVLAKGLDRVGVVGLGPMVDPPALLGLVEDFGRFATDLERRCAEGRASFVHHHEQDHYWPDTGVAISNNALCWSPRLAEIAASPLALDLVEWYFGKPARLQRVQAVRYEAGIAGGAGEHMFRWHHDMEGHRLKLMVLLTRVTEADHAMVYVRGSHRLKHGWTDFQSNAIDLDACRSRLGTIEVTRLIGEPGEAYLFDSHGVHMARRLPGGRTRDAFIVEYSGDSSNVFGAALDEQEINGLSPRAADLVRDLCAQEPRWLQPLAGGPPQWHRTLHTPRAWTAPLSKREG